MGRNASIKRYNAKSPGQPVELWEDRHGRLPIVLELLASPWIMRASELARRDGALATKHSNEPIEVVWSDERQCPLEFSRGAKAYRIDGIVQTWSAERSWWDRRHHIARRYWRVLARGGVYDLAYDKLEQRWRLVGIQD